MQKFFFSFENKRAEVVNLFLIW